MPSQYVFGAQGLPGPGKPVLTVDTTFYLRPDGNDTQTGAANNIGEAWRTLQYAFDWVAQNIHINGHIVTFQLADGSYSGYKVTFAGVNAKPDGVIYVHGNTATPANVVITPISNTCIGLPDGSPGYMVFINDLTFQGSSTAHFAVLVVYPESLVTLGCDPTYTFYGTIRFTGTFGAIIFADYSASAEVYGTVRLSLSAAFDVFAYTLERAMIFMDLNALFMDVAQSFTDFIRADRLSYAFYTNAAQTGTFTGRGYSISSNSVLRQASTVPGSVAGITATGGQVV